MYIIGPPALGECRHCGDLTYPCDGCGAAVCASQADLCDLCVAEADDDEICDGCGEAGATCEYDGFVFHNTECWGLAEQRYRATPEGRRETFATLIAFEIEDLDWQMGLHTGRYVLPSACEAPPKAERRVINIGPKVRGSR